MEINCQKVRFKSRKLAQKRLGEILENTPRFSYWCEQCRGYHLTKQAPKTEDDRIENMGVFIAKLKERISWQTKMICDLNVKIQKLEEESEKLRLQHI